MRLPRSSTTPYRDVSSVSRSRAQTSVSGNSRARARKPARFVSNQESPFISKKRSSSKCRACHKAPPVPAGIGSRDNLRFTGFGSCRATLSAKAATSSERCPASRRISVIPNRDNSRSIQAKNGRPPQSSKGFGVPAVSEPRRVPSPPTRTAHCRGKAATLFALSVVVHLNVFCYVRSRPRRSIWQGP